MKKVYIGGFEDESNLEPEFQQLRPILIPKNADAVGKQLKDLQLRESGIEIIAMRRNDTKQFKPHGNIRLNPNDIIIAYGTFNDLETAENKLLKGAE